jgi:formiminotetrahydrofolate cyclodeaminase
MYKDSLKPYLNDLAGRKPAPGGGSAAALAAATGAALISMVCNFTVGKEKYKAVEAEIKEMLSSAEGLRAEFMDLVDKDVAAYKKVSSAYTMPKETDDEKKIRGRSIQEALKEALAVPLEVCICCYRAMKLCPEVGKKGNSNLVSDVGVAIALLESAFRSALLNVEINLSAIKDKECIVEVRRVLDPLEKETGIIAEAVWQAVKDTMTKGA